MLQPAAVGFSQCCCICSDIRFSRLDQADTKAVAVVGTNNDGWQHYRINLAALAGSGTAIADSQSFDRLIISDVSGMGFKVLLDDVQLLYGLDNFKAAEGAAEETFMLAEGQTGVMPPVFGDDLIEVKPGVCSNV
eukprot:GHRQ01020309.1.p1 GENE.GHRQ01020309.1~~GHRQ01020309.1.p1  ORF type:complete len:135 (+),score=24.97 GHRQ01020309.1:165-569(+)